MKTIKKTLIALSIGFTAVSYADDYRYIIQVEKGHNGIVKNLAKQLGAQIHVEGEEFFSATFSGHDLTSLKGVLKNPHIKLIEEDARRELLSLYNDDVGNPTAMQLTPYAVYQSQANQLALQPNSGIKVCVIDSGLDRSNADFNWENISGDDDVGTGKWDQNGGPHGTHVAGTIAAADNGFGVVGMAPGIDLHIIKVFNANGWGYSSDLAYASEKCQAAGAKIINMSLGGGRPNSTEETAFKNFTSAGGLVIAAAGNDGNDVRTYPAGYSSVMMVGANDADNQIAAFSQFPPCTVSISGNGKKNNESIIDTTCVEVTAGGVNTLSTYPADMAVLSMAKADQQVIASSGFSYASTGSVTAAKYFMGLADKVDMNAQGKVCVIDRGNISFDEKVSNCENSGGVGAIIINNVDGMLYGTLGESTLTTIPAVATSMDNRPLLLAANEVTVEISSSDYGYMSGTSMATPAVSGLAALLWSNHPNCTGSDIRAAFKATALDGGVTGRDDHFGYGIVQVLDAHNYLLNNGCNSKPAVDIELSLTSYVARGKTQVELNWSGATSRKVDIYRNGVMMTSTPNDGYTTDAIASAYGMYTYAVCEASTNNCSDNISIEFK